MLSATSRLVQRALSTAKMAEKHLVAVCQMTTQHDLQANFETCKGMIERAGERKCRMIFFPECFDYIGRNKEENISLAMTDDCEYIAQFRALAKQHKIWLSLGGLHRSDPSGFPWNTHLIIDSDGQTRSRYNKLHLFDLDIPGKVRLMESEFSRAGTHMVAPVESPVGKVGLSICYDLRFPEQSIWNRKKGADILTFPAAFTLTTGLAHWEVLLRARAIENQCYVVAAAQTGKHNEKRMSYGHAMIVDPWGAVVAQCSERVDMAFAEIDLGYVAELRQMQPVYSHRRSDLYSLHVNEADSSNDTMQFALFPIRPECIFYRSAHCFAFVNLKPVLSGHVLISTKKVHKRLTDLSDEETADMFVLAKKVQRMLEKELQVTSSTVCVQDGPAAGQTVEHVHVHVLPRKPGDFGCTPDNLYENLEKHDKDPEVKPRTHEEMAAEAAVYRKLMLEH